MSPMAVVQNMCCEPSRQKWEGEQGGGWAGEVMQQGTSAASGPHRGGCSDYVAGNQAGAVCVPAGLDWLQERRNMPAMQKAFAAILGKTGRKLPPPTSC